MDEGKEGNHGKDFDEIDEKEDHDKSEEEHMDEAFSEFDLNGDNLHSLDEIMAIFGEYCEEGDKEYYHECVKDIKEAFNEFDRNGDGVVDKEEYFEMPNN